MQTEPGSHQCPWEAGSDVPRDVPGTALLHPAGLGTGLPAMLARRKDLHSQHLLRPQVNN